jgi:hypothetical protein
MKKIILFAAVLISIISCKKTNKGSQTSGVHLSKLIRLDTTQQAPNDTLEINTYTYDNSGRWISEEDLPAGDNGYADIADGADRTINTNSYAGNSIVPNLIVTSEYSGGTLFDTYYDYNVSFSSTGLLLKDSDVVTAPGFPSDATIYEYSYNGSTVIESQIDLSNSSSTETDTATQTKVNGNIVSQVDYVGSSDNGDGTFTASYDTNPNPFPDASTSIYPTVDDDNLDFGQKNNLTEITGQSEGTPVHTKYTYTYNANGYPATVVVYDWSSGSPVFVYKGIYVY